MFSCLRGKFVNLCFLDVYFMSVNGGMLGADVAEDTVDLVFGIELLITVDDKGADIGVRGKWFDVAIDITVPVDGVVVFDVCVDVNADFIGFVAEFNLVVIFEFVVINSVKDCFDGEVVDFCKDFSNVLDIDVLVFSFRFNFVDRKCLKVSGTVVVYVSVTVEVLAGKTVVLKVSFVVLVVKIKELYVSGIFGFVVGTSEDVVGNFELFSDDAIKAVDFIVSSGIVAGCDVFIAGNFNVDTVFCSFLSVIVGIDCNLKVVDINAVLREDTVIGMFADSTDFDTVVVVGDDFDVEICEL